MCPRSVQLLYKQLGGARVGERSVRRKTHSPITHSASARGGTNIVITLTNVLSKSTLSHEHGEHVSRMLYERCWRLYLFSNNGNSFSQIFQLLIFAYNDSVTAECAMAVHSYYIYNVSID